MPSLVEIKHSALPQGNLGVTTHHLGCPPVQCCSGFNFPNFKMFSSRKKKKKKGSSVFGLVLNSNSSATHNSIANEAGQLFPKYSIRLYPIPGNKAWFSPSEMSCSLPAPSCSRWQMFSQLHLSHFVLENREDIEIYWLLSLSAFQYVFCIMRAQILLALLML